MTGSSVNKSIRSGDRTSRPIATRHSAHVCALALAVCGVLAVPGRAFAQTDKWEVDVAPLYFWAASIGGHVAINDTGVPIHVDFADAAKKLAGAFTLHVEARNGRWGILSDINFVRLSTDINATTPISGRPLTATAKMDTVIFEGGVSYLVVPAANFNVIGGVRTYTLSPQLNFTGPGSLPASIDASRTATSAFGGFTYRPKLSDKVYFLSRADIGGGQAFTWSATAGVEYRFKPWAGVMVGYHALGINTGNVPTSGPVVKDVEYDVTQYGPIFALIFHWKQK
jgi:hypothetical protein